MLKLYNSLTRKIEEFNPIDPPQVGMYTCGMTVYDYAHIGHSRKYVTDDVLRRTLTYLGYSVKHVQNVTDVGHLSSDADDGEDKLEKGAEKFGKTVWEVAEFFTKHFYDSMESLNILKPDVVCRATEHITEQIELIGKLFEKGIAYDTKEAVYFDISKFPTYSDLFGQSLLDKKTAVREEVETGSHKKHPADFVLWFKRVGRFADHAMHWDSPWGDGFPGWHIECSAMSMKYLGDQFDIHTGGEDHIPVHHPNEIAQSEGATGHAPFARYWVHTTFLMVEGQKMSKSLGNFYTIEDVIKKGFNPLSLRYLFFTTHYKKQMNFTWEALSSAQSAYNKLQAHVSVYRQDHSSERTQLSEEKLSKVSAFQSEFRSALENDLNMPKAIAVVWEVIKSNIPDYDKYDLLVSFDEVLGLSLDTAKEVVVSTEAKDLLDERERLRSISQFDEADLVREKIERLGFSILDTKDGPKLIAK